MKKIEKIAIVGAGALGIMYGEMLTKAYGKEKVCYAADEKRAVRYRQQGCTSNGVPCDFRYESYDSAGIVDLVIFAVKYNGLAAAAQAASPLIGEETIMLSVLNGVASEEVLAELYGEQHILHCVAQGMDAVKEGNELSYQNAGMLVIGRKENDCPQMVQAVQQVIEKAGIQCLVVDDIMHRMWGKLMLNTGLNQVCAVFGMTYGGVQSEGEARDMMVAAMREVQQVAKCEGICLSEEDIEGWMKLIDSLNPEGMPSMRQDTKAGRKTEVELFAGTICRLAKIHGITTPVNDFLYQRIKALEREMDSFYAEPIPEDVFASMKGRSFKEDGVSKRDELRLLHVLYMGFDKEIHDGELVVNTKIAYDVLHVMKELYQAAYPIEKMVLVDRYDADDIRSMEDNNSSAFNDRYISGTVKPSKHAYGMAVDINPLYNPYIKTKDGELICEPPSALCYADRSQDFPHKIVRGDDCVRIFEAYGFTWGGDWTTAKDYQHFEK